MKNYSLTSVMLIVFISLSLHPSRLWAADEIKLGVLSTAGDHWPRWVAWDQGFFKEQNLEVREFQTDSIAKAVQALSANSTDMLFPANTQGVVVAMSKGAAIKIVAGDFTKALYDLITGAKYKKVEDLKGGTMGVINLTSGSTVLLQKILGAHGLKYPGDYDLLTVGGTPARYAAVKKGAVAAAMVTIPTSYEAKEDGLNVLANVSSILPDYQFTVIAGNTSWMAGHKDQTVRFLMAMIKAMRFLNDPKNKEASMQSMIKHFKVSKKYAELAYQEVMQQLHPINNDAAPSMKGMETVIQLEVENKGLDKSYPVKQFIDDSYRLEALKRLGK
ncbi:MAG TPA: ABC transporter substrate-binding protein [Candidatus Binatia bacterium]|jgi:ABC-type nitrate/sulfonate/bicarbonate transport system substrate-binding protein